MHFPNYRNDMDAPANSLEVIYTVATAKLKTLNDVVDSQERKAGIFLTATSALIAGAFTTIPSNLSEPAWIAIFALLLSPLAIAAAFSYWHCLRTLVVKVFRIDPKLAGLANDCAALSDQETKAQLIAQYIDIEQRIQPHLVDKAHHLKATSSIWLPVMIAALIFSVCARCVYIASTQQTLTLRERKMSTESGQSTGESAGTGASDSGGTTSTTGGTAPSVQPIVIPPVNPNLVHEVIKSHTNSGSKPTGGNSSGTQKRR